MWLVCTILLVSGGLKLIDSMGTIKALDAQHPILFLTYRQVELLVGFIEMALCGWCLVSRGDVRSMCSVLGYSLCLICYKIVHSYLNSGEPCHCLGVILGWWPWLKANEEQITWAVIGALVFLPLCRLFFIIGCEDGCESIGRMDGIQNHNG